MNKFSQLFSNFTNVQLLKITHNPEHYEPLAIQTATEELKSRNLTEEEMQMSVDAYYELEKQKALKEQQNRDLVDKLSFGLWNKSNTKKQIVFMGLVYFGFSIYGSYSRLSLYLFMFESNQMWDSSTLLVVGMEIFPYLTLLFYWMKTRVGWILFTGTSIFTFLGLFLSLLNAMSPLNETYFVSPSLSVAHYFVLVIKCLLFGYFTFLLFQQPMRQAFGFGKPNSQLDVLDEDLLDKVES